MERLCVKVKEACKMLSIGRSSLYKLDIPYVKLCNCRIYRIADLEAYISAHTVSKKGEAQAPLDAAYYKTLENFIGWVEEQEESAAEIRRWQGAGDAD